MRAVLRRVPFGQCGGAVARPAVRVDQHARRAVQPLTHIEDRLVLEAVIAGVEIEIAGPLRYAEPLVIVELRHPRPDRVAAGQGGEEGAGGGVLRVHPGADVRILADVILQPAIGVGDPLAELRLDDVAARRRGISGALGRLGLSKGGGGERKQEESWQVRVARDDWEVVSEGVATEV